MSWLALIVALAAAWLGYKAFCLILYWLVSPTRAGRSHLRALLRRSGVDPDMDVHPAVIAGATQWALARTLRPGETRPEAAPYAQTLEYAAVLIAANVRDEPLLPEGEFDWVEIANHADRFIARR